MSPDEKVETFLKDDESTHFVMELFCCNPLFR